MDNSYFKCNKCNNHFENESEYKLHKKQKGDCRKNTNQSDNLVKRAFQLKDENEKKLLFQQALKLDKNNGNALMQLGLYELQNNTEKAFSLLEQTFEKSSKPAMPLHTHQAQYIGGLIARYNVETKRYKKAEKFLKLILSSNTVSNVAQRIQLTTLISGYPESIQDAKNIITRYHERIDSLLKLDNLDLSYVNDTDPYIFCMLTMFYIEIYHECDMKTIMNKFYKLAIKAFPTLSYKDPLLSDYLNNNLISESNSKSNSESNSDSENIDYKYELGIASAFFSKNSSVLADFQGVLERLPSNKYNITYIYFNESGAYSEFLANKQNVLIYTKSDKNWLERARNEIGLLNLDLLLALDSTMSSYCQRALMSKLAKIQAVSHGHPVTSGIDREFVDFYVSWAAAELDYETAQTHYTEKLMLLPANCIHQYYSIRVNDRYSLINNMEYNHLTRSDFSDYIPETGNWYLCMQKSFKRHPEFDYMLKDILSNDLDARILLHNGDNDEINTIILNRFKKLEMDMSRIHLIDAQPHHKLTALYILSDVILDSYPAGGCTTTREALEVGGIVVTLPSTYLGGRWSLAYYKIMGVMDMVATSKKEYVDIAVKLGKCKTTRTRMKDKILENVNKLFYKNDAVDAWDTIIEKMILSYYSEL